MQMCINELVQYYSDTGYRFRTEELGHFATADCLVPHAGNLSLILGSPALPVLAMASPKDNATIRTELVKARQKVTTVR